MSPDIEWQRLEADLVAAVERAVRDVLGRHAGDGPALVIQPEGVSFSDWPYTWPDGTEERFDECRYYRVQGPSGNARVLVGTVTRFAWSELRHRTVVFGQVGGREAKTHRPWTEFVRTDDGTFAATIPDPRRPRGLLHEGDPLPDRLRNARVARADQVFHSMINAPSLRFVVGGDDIQEMIRHGYWVASLRKRL